ncbi:MAG TPA: transposase [Opitutaceae bacterium]|nr:transposase [Opitutaceae bacterium]
MPERRTDRLHLGRQSLAGATYFVTACTNKRRRVLTDSIAAQAALAALGQLQAAGDAEILAATLMPDHVHLLFVLGSRIELSQVTGKFKNQARSCGRAPWRWQKDVYEHRLRPDETAEDYGFYIFMNPYRAGLVRSDERWPHWFCSSRFDFLAAVKDSEPIPSESIPRSIQFRAPLSP